MDVFLVKFKEGHENRSMLTNRLDYRDKMSLVGLLRMSSNMEGRQVSAMVSLGSVLSVVQLSRV